jgi:hypothetical protein
MTDRTQTSQQGVRAEPKFLRLVVWQFYVWTSLAAID